MTGAEILCTADDRERWLELRRQGIGSSDAPSILGVSPFKSALAVYAEKIGIEEDREETEAMRWGRILEPHILEEFGRETMRHVERSGDLVRSREIPWLMCTRDGEESSEHKRDPGIVEAKATGWRAGDWSEGVPRPVWVQLQHQLATTGQTWGSVVVLIRGCQLLWADVERDSRFIDEILLPAEEEFWRRVQNRDPVNPDGSRSAADALRALYPEEIPGKVVQLEGSLVSLDDERTELKGLVKQAEARIECIDQQIKAAIGDAQAGYLASGAAYTYKLQRRAGFTVAPAEFRVLRRTAPKGR